jgi:hypothetical protein
MVSVIQVCWQFAKPVWHIPLPCVQWKTLDDGQKNCPKHVEFRSKKKIWEISASSWYYYTNFKVHFGLRWLVCNSAWNFKWKNNKFLWTWPGGWKLLVSKYMLMTRNHDKKIGRWFRVYRSYKVTGSSSFAAQQQVWRNVYRNFHKPYWKFWQLRAWDTVPPEERTIT